LNLNSWYNGIVFSKIQFLFALFVFLQRDKEITIQFRRQQLPLQHRTNDVHIMAFCFFKIKQDVRVSKVAKINGFSKKALDLG